MFLQKQTFSANDIEMQACTVGLGWIKNNYKKKVELNLVVTKLSHILFLYCQLDIHSIA